MHPLDGAVLRVQRAGKHIADFERREKRWREAHRKNTTYDFNPVTQRAVVIHKGTRPISPQFAILLGEAVYNLRAALDYLVYQLAIHDSPTGNEKSQFPIDETEADFEGHRRNWMKGVNDAHVEAIRQLQPFMGCDWPRVLRDLSNPDKHRKLTHNEGTVDSLVQFEMGDAASFAGRPGKVFPRQGIWRGQVRDVYVYAKGTLAVTFSDRRPVLAVLKQLAGDVAATIEAFRSEFE